IDHDDAADVPQPELLDDLPRGFEVRLEDRLLLVLLADVAAGIDVDRGERLGLVEDEIAARFEPYAALEGARDLRLDPVLIEDRGQALVEVHAGCEPRHERGDELDDAVMVLPRI